MNQSKPVKPGNAATQFNRLPWVLLGMIILFVVVVRVRLLEFPLERDEGEYAYAGQLILEGIPPYKLAYNMKLPGTYYAYAAIMALFGQTPAGIHFGFMLVNVATIWLMFLLARRLLGLGSAVVAAAVYGVMSLSPSVLGFCAHATHFVIVCALAGMVLLLRGLESGRRLMLLFSGLAFGFSFLMKQPGLMFGVFGGAWLLWTDLRPRPLAWKRIFLRLGVFAAGLALPFLLVCVVLYVSGVFERFWFWTFVYASSYASQMPVSGGFWALYRYFGHLIGPNIVFWAMASAGVAVMLLSRTERVKMHFILSFSLASAIAVSAGLYFREHYFVLLLPAVGLLVAMLLAVTRDLLERKWPAWAGFLPNAFFALAFGYVVLNHALLFFRISPQEMSNVVFGNHPQFQAAREVARHIRENTREDDRIAVVGSEPELYFLSRRHSATGYIYTYPLMELHPYARKMQEEMIREIELSKPGMMVFVGFQNSWTTRPDADQHIIEWFERYAKAYYDRVGVMDFLSSSEVVTRWGAEAAGYRLQSKTYIDIYKRRSSIQITDKEHVGYVVQALETLGSFQLRAGKTAEAIAHYREALTLDPNSLNSLNNLAWIQATHRAARFRNGIEAVKLAEHLCAVSNDDVPDFQATLAAAYAENGEFEHAVAAMKKAIAGIEKSRSSELQSRWQARLELFREHQPYRE